MPTSSARNPVEAQHLYDHIRTVAFYLDALTSAVPAFQDSPVQIGIEPIIATFLPFLGPFIGAALGAYVILMCCLFGIPLALIARMVRARARLYFLS